MKDILRYYLSHINHRLSPYQYDESKYEDTFLANSPYITNCKLHPIDRVIYVFWTGDNPMTQNRLNSMEVLKKKSGVEIKLITPENLSQYILPNAPLHPAYEYLSLNHRSDYLRCYFMHYYGGGYSDIKECQFSWLPMFDRLENSQAWLIGYPETRKMDLAGSPYQKIRKTEMVKYISQMVGNGSYIFRKNTPFTTEWIKELHQRLDRHYDKLLKHRGNTWGDNQGYPITWAGIGGDVVHPLALKYMKFTLKDKRLRPVLINYR